MFKYIYNREKKLDEKKNIFMYYTIKNLNKSLEIKCDGDKIIESSRIKPIDYKRLYDYALYISDKVHGSKNLSF